MSEKNFASYGDMETLVTEITNKRLRTFQGTIEEWNALTTEQKKTYDHASIPNSIGGDITFPANKVIMTGGGNVEEAVDELDNGVGTLGEVRVEITSDGVKTYSQLLDELYSYRSRLCRIDFDSTMYYPATATRYGHVGSSSANDVNIRIIVIKETGSVFKTITVNSSTGAIGITDLSSRVLNAGVKIKLIKSFMG